MHSSGAQKRRGARPEPGHGLWAEVGVWKLQAVASGTVGWGRLQSGGGRSPGVGAGVALAASSWREELCEAGKGGAGFYTLPSGRLAKELKGVLHKQGHSSHSSPPSCLINSHRIDPDPLTLRIPPSEKAGTLQLTRKKKKGAVFPAQHQIDFFPPPCPPCTPRDNII